MIANVGLDVGTRKGRLLIQFLELYLTPQNNAQTCRTHPTSQRGQPEGL